MRVVYIGAFRFPTFDAAAARVLNIGRALRDAGHEVTFVAWGGRYGDHFCQERGCGIYDGFNFYVSGELNSLSALEKIGNKLRPGAASLSVLGRLLSETDVVVAYNPAYGFNKKLARLCQRHSIKYVTDLTEWYDNNELRFTDYLPNWLNMRRFNRYHVKHKIVISSYLDRFYKEGHNIVVPAMCDSKDLKWSVRRNDVPTNGLITLIYAGNPAKKDKLFEVVNALARLERECPGRVRLLVLGIDRANFISAYHKLLDTDCLPESIEFKGRVAQDEVPRYYAESDFMVLLRDDTRKSNAGFPTKFAESMMSGTPVIANLTSDLGLYLKDGKNGFVVSKPTAKALFKTLKNKVLKLDSGRLKVFKDNAHETGLGSFDYSNYTTKLQAFFNNLD